jgi:hypothetical protein
VADPLAPRRGHGVRRSRAAPWKDRHVVPPAGAVEQRRPRVWPWVVILVVGVAMTVGGFSVFVGRTIVALLDHPVSTTPYTHVSHFDTGTYYVFEAETATFNGPQTTPLTVTVSAVGGGRVPLFRPAATETITSGGNAYRGVVGFTIDVAGRYLVTVETEGGVGRAPIFVAPSITTSLRSGVGWLGLAGLGIVVGLLGLVMMIVQLTRRSRRRAPPGVAPRCANGHLAGPTDRFCATCGAPVYHVATAPPS